jgi:hypothetical protein
MTTFESAVKKIDTNEKDIFNTLSDLRNIEKIKEKIPQDKIKEVILEQDSISFVVDPIGSISLKIIEREPFRTIKFTAEKSPIDFLVWIQLKEITASETALKVTLKADLNVMLKMVASKPLDQFVNMLAEALAGLSYSADSIVEKIDM